MNSLEKFYSDAQKLVKKNPVFDMELTNLFCKAILSCNKQAVCIAEGLSEYWLRTYANSVQNGEEAVEWFYKAGALINAEFEDDMDFENCDWEEINLIVSSEAGEMDMELLNSIMSILVSRKKI